MIEVLQALYNYLKNDNGKDSKGNWLDDYDHLTYLQLLSTDANNFHKHLIPAKQPEILDENLPIVSFYIAGMPPTRWLDRFFKEITVDFDIYTNDNTLEQNLKIAKRQFQLLEDKIIPISYFSYPNQLPYIGKWHHLTEMSSVLVNPNLFCYTQRFVTAVKREFLVSKRKK